MFAPRVVPPFWLARGRWRSAYNLPALLAGILLALVVLLLSSIVSVLYVAVINERVTRCASGPARTGAARRKNHAGIPSAPSAVWWRESSILNIRASVTRLLFLVTVHFFAGVWYCGSCEMAA